VQRKQLRAGGTFARREGSETYVNQFAVENDVLSLENTISWEENAEST